MNRQHVFDSIPKLTSQWITEWTTEQRSALKDLETAEDRFGRGFSIYEAPVLSHDTTPDPDWCRFKRRELAFDNDFLAQMKQLLDRGAYIAHISESEIALNRNYSNLMNRLRAQESGAPLGLAEERRIERYWVAYRDAWVALVKALFGPAQADNWYGRMTEQRAATLAKLSAITGPPDPITKPWLSLCAHAKRAALPPDIQAEPVKPQQPTCNSYGPYYGIGGPVDFRAARNCAIAERNSNNFRGDFSTGSSYDIDGSINGSVVLAMLYANGEGVPRNAQLAQRFACEAIDLKQIDNEDLDRGGSPEETEENRVNFYLEPLRKIASAQPPHIDLCDYVDGPTRAISQCDVIATALQDQKRASEFTALRNKLTPKQRDAFDRLLAAMRAFVVAHAYNEIAMTGHGISNGQTEAAYAGEEEAFLADLQRFELGDLPNTTPAEFTADDSALNTAYAKAIASAPEEQGGEHQTGSEPTRQSIRETERLWIVYRDALADFGMLRYPKIGRKAWLAFVTLQRIEELKNIFAE